MVEHVLANAYPVVEATIKDRLLRPAFVEAGVPKGI